jgi:hypothetical protein
MMSLISPKQKAELNSPPAEGESLLPGNIAKEIRQKEVNWRVKSTL